MRGVDQERGHGGVVGGRLQARSRRILAVGRSATRESKRVEQRGQVAQRPESEISGDTSRGVAAFWRFLERRSLGHARRTQQCVDEVVQRDSGDAHAVVAPL